MEAVPIADGPRFAAITEDDHRGIVIIIAALFMVWMVLCLVIRSYIRIEIAHRFSPDDYFIMAASVSISSPLFCGASDTRLTIGGSHHNRSLRSGSLLPCLNPRNTDLESV